MKSFFWLVVIVALIAFGYFLVNNNSDLDNTTDDPVDFENTVGVDEVVEGEANENVIKNNVITMDEVKNIVLKTNKGDITIELYKEEAPKTVENFIKLANEDFYDGIKFHRVISGFMIQGGDPLTKNNELKSQWGTGGPGYAFEDEIHAKNRNDIGTLAMANSGANTNGSQFFINTANNNFLDTKHTVFGKITSGIDIVSVIEGVDTDGDDRPIEDVVIEDVVIVK